MLGHSKDWRLDVRLQVRGLGIRGNRSDLQGDPGGRFYGADPATGGGGGQNTLTPKIGRKRQPKKRGAILRGGVPHLMCQTTALGMRGTSQNICAAGKSSTTSRIVWTGGSSPQTNKIHEDD